MQETVTLITFGSAALIMALIAGVFLAFSDFIMRSLRAASSSAGIEAMQLINRKVFSSIFLVWLLGMVPASIGLAIYAWGWIEGAARTWFIVGCLIYVVGTFLVTMLGNVPMNRRLGSMDVGATATRQYWTTYAKHWTLWNHVRTACAILAAGALLIGCALCA